MEKRYEHLSEVEVGRQKWTPRNIKRVFIGRHVGDVADPHWIGTLDLKTVPEHIRGHRQGMTRIRRYAEPAFLSAA